MITFGYAFLIYGCWPSRLIKSFYYFDECAKSETKPVWFGTNVPILVKIRFVITAAYSSSVSNAQTDNNAQDA